MLRQAFAVLLCFAFQGATEGTSRTAFRSANALRHQEIQCETGKIEEGRLMVSNRSTVQTEVDWIHGYSALRDPLRNEVRFFFDSFTARAEAVKTVSFLRVGQSSLKTAANVSDCILQTISHPDAAAMATDPELVKVEDQVEFVEGWQLTCTDPGEEYSLGVFVYESKYTLFSVETIEVEKRGRVAICMAPLYSARLLTKPWLSYNARQGVEHFTIYRALTSNWTSKMTPWMLGIWPSKDLIRHAPVEIFHREGVQWFTYYPPPLRYMHGQSTILNDCLVRNRYLFDYVLVTDVDEYVRMVSEPSQSLGSLLDKHFPADASSLVLPRFTFPSHCCERQLDQESVDNEEQSAQFIESCRIYTMKDHDLGKSVFRPQLVDGIFQHAILYHPAHTQGMVFLEPEVAHLVHIRLDPGWNLPMGCDVVHGDRMD